MNLKGSRTEANLMSAFTNEAMQREKYTIYSYKAQEEGFEQISELFKYTADNEREHAEIWYKLLNNNTVPATLANLKTAAENECYEHTELYKNYADEARKEGFDDIAALFESVAAVEQQHEQRFRKLAQNVENNEVFSKDSESVWECRKCGNTVNAKAAPDPCPVCSHPQADYQLKAENY